MEQMNIEESIEQLKSLIEHFNNGGNDFNATDIDAIKILLKENQKLKKQLETYEIEGYEQNEELDKMSFDVRKYKLQQKEFITYLEDKKISPVKVFFLILSILYLLLMIWCFSIGEYKTIIKSICIAIGGFILGIIYSSLGGKE